MSSPFLPSALTTVPSALDTFSRDALEEALERAEAWQRERIETFLRAKMDVDRNLIDTQYVNDIRCKSGGGGSDGGWFGPAPEDPLQGVEFVYDVPCSWEALDTHTIRPDLFALAQRELRELLRREPVFDLPWRDRLLWCQLVAHWINYALLATNLQPQVMGLRDWTLPYGPTTPPPEGCRGRVASGEDPTKVCPRGQESPYESHGLSPDEARCAEGDYARAVFPRRDKFVKRLRQTLGQRCAQSPHGSWWYVESGDRLPSRVGDHDQNWAFDDGMVWTHGGFVWDPSYDDFEAVQEGRHRTSWLFRFADSGLGMASFAFHGPWAMGRPGDGGDRKRGEVDGYPLSLLRTVDPDVEFGGNRSRARRAVRKLESERLTTPKERIEEFFAQERNYADFVPAFVVIGNRTNRWGYVPSPWLVQQYLHHAAKDILAIDFFEFVNRGMQWWVNQHLPYLQDRGIAELTPEQVAALHDAQMASARAAYAGGVATIGMSMSSLVGGGTYAMAAEAGGSIGQMILGSSNSVGPWPIFSVADCPIALFVRSLKREADAQGNYQPCRPPLPPLPAAPPDMPKKQGSALWALLGGAAGLGGAYYWWKMR